MLSSTLIQLQEKSLKKKRVKRMFGYLSSNYETAKFIAQLQSHMVETVKGNFPQHYKPNFMCNLCFGVNRSKLLGSNNLTTYIPLYEDIFDDRKPEEQVSIASLL